MHKKETDPVRGPNHAAPIGTAGTAETPLMPGTTTTRPSASAAWEGNGEPACPLASFQSNSDRTTTLTVAVWGNPMTGEDGSTWIRYEMTFSRSSKGQDGTWRPSASYRVQDIPVLLYLLQKAYDWVTATRQEHTDVP